MHSRKYVFIFSPKLQNQLNLVDIMRIINMCDLWPWPGDPLDSQLIFFHLFQSNFTLSRTLCHNSQLPYQTKLYFSKFICYIWNVSKLKWTLLPCMLHVATGTYQIWHSGHCTVHVWIVNLGILFNANVLMMNPIDVSCYYPVWIMAINMSIFIAVSLLRHCPFGY